MIYEPRPFDALATPAREWFPGMAESGVPAVVPCRVNGERALFSAALSWVDPTLRAYAVDRRRHVRVLVALESCRRAYIGALAAGGSIAVP